MSDKISIDHLKRKLTATTRDELAFGITLAEHVRPAFALALEALEREGLIPGEAPELREVGPGSAEMREKFAGILAAAKAGAATKESRRDAIKALETMRLDMAPWYFDQIAELRIAFLKDLSAEIESAKAKPIARRTSDLQEALKLQGVALGPDATEAVVRALEALGGDAS